MNIKYISCLFLIVLGYIEMVHASGSPVAGTPGTRRLDESRMGILWAASQAGSSPALMPVLVGCMAPPTSPHALSPSNQDMDHLRTRLAQLDVIHLESPDAP